MNELLTSVSGGLTLAERNGMYARRREFSRIRPGRIAIFADGTDLVAEVDRQFASSKQTETTPSKQIEKPQVTYLIPPSTELFLKLAEIDEESWSAAEWFVPKLEIARVGGGRRKAIELPQSLDVSLRQEKSENSGTWGVVRWFFQRVLFRCLNDLQKEGGENPEPRVLQVALVAYGLDELEHLMLRIEQGDPTPYRPQRMCLLDEDGLVRAASSATERALEHWNPSFLEEQRRRSSKGGSASRRGGIWHQPKNVIKLKQFRNEGQTIKEMAQRFKVSSSTIDRGIDYLKHPEKLDRERSRLKLKPRKRTGKGVRFEPISEA